MSLLLVWHWAAHTMLNAYGVEGGSMFFPISAMEDGLHVKCPGATSRPSSPGWTPSENTCIGDAFEAEYGYVNLATRENEPPSGHCSKAEHRGRMTVQPADSILWVCMESGWMPFTP